MATETKICEGCGKEIIHLKDSTGEYENQDEADSYEHPNLCHTCAAGQRESERESGEISTAIEAPDDGMPSTVTGKKGE